MNNFKKFKWVKASKFLKYASANVSANRFNFDDGQSSLKGDSLPGQSLSYQRQREGANQRNGPQVLNTSGNYLHTHNQANDSND